MSRGSSTTSNAIPGQTPTWRAPSRTGREMAAMFESRRAATTSTRSTTSTNIRRRNAIARAQADFARAAASGAMLAGRASLRRWRRRSRRAASG